MATKVPRPARTLGIFLIVVVLLYGLAAIGGTWKPKLGLDLAGGTRFTLVPDSKEKTPSSSQLNQAAGIIRQRVNGNGVTEAKVAVAGPNVVVEIPGSLSSDMEASIARQAQLRFRIAAQCGSSACARPAVKDTVSLPILKQVSPPSVNEATPDIATDLAWAKSPSSAWTSVLALATCTPRSKGVARVPAFANDLPLNPTLSTTEIAALAEDAITGAMVAPADRPSRPIVACDDTGTAYLLSPAAIEGDQISSASAGTDSKSLGWAINLNFKSNGANVFESLSRQMVAGGAYGGMQFAIVLDGSLLSAPGFNGVISGGQAQITGSYNQDSATALANQLNFGSLPVKFDLNASSDTAISAELAGSQLSAGIIAGVIGMLIVMLYCFLYYRGLGVVVVASLLFAAIVTYAVVLVLGATAGFALSLPGIAGLIVAVGITADSFIVYFERIRDEMRDGKSMRVAVQAGWLRARNTCLAADTVSLLAAASLYMFAIDEVRGFAFALGITTLIDLGVFFWFTHPVISLLSHRTFFNAGHRLSGLSPESLGVPARRGLVRKVDA